MTLASDVIATARRTLQDADEDRWLDATLLGYLNTARTALAVAKPEVYQETDDWVLAAGPKQSLPAGARILFDIHSNKAAVGGAYGSRISIVEGKYLDAFVPSWRSMTAAETEHFTYDERDPLTFWVYPPAVAGAVVEASFSEHPVAFTLASQLDAREDVFKDGLADYVIGRALLEDTASPANAQRAVTHIQAFAALIGEDWRKLLTFSPNANSARAAG